jgi:RNA polymerase sigma factor (sigma-70 family)
LAGTSTLVHSAALRQVRSPQLAEEVAQSVFTDLARNAAKLTTTPDAAPVLTAWLYQVTRRTAIDVVRREARRQLREQIATDLNAMNATAADWTHIEPLLDEAMAALDETDRTAVLLRYFENQSLREVGVTLGTSDDAAQKRVSRAVERLREFFAKRGVTVGASGLAVVISANAVQAAPVGLALTISTAAALTGTTLATTATVTATKAIAMTALQKTIVTATIAVLAGAGIYEARQASQLRDQVQTLQQQQAPMADQIQQLQAGYENATNTIVALKEEFARSQKNDSELLKLRGEVGVLRQQNAGLQKVLSDIDGDMQKADVIRQTEMLKSYTEQKLNDAQQFVLAMKLFAEDHNQMSPTNFSQVAQYLGGDSNPVLARFKQFEIAYQGALNDPACSSNTVLVRGTDIWPTVGGSLVRVYGFADGHSDLTTVFNKGGRDQEKGQGAAHQP